MAAKYTPAWFDQRRTEVADLLEELLRWALVREKVLVKLDVKAAIAARALADELSRVADELPRDHTDDSLAMTLVEAKLNRLEEKARRMMAEGDRPLSSNPSPALPRTGIRLRDDSPDGMPAADGQNTPDGRSGGNRG